MRFAFETFRKSPSEIKAIQLGKTWLTLRKKELVLLEKLSARLLRMNQSQLTFDIEPDDIQVSTPDGCGPLKDYRLQIVLTDDTRASRFNLVARQTSDNSLIFTSRALVPST